MSKPSVVKESRQGNLLLRAHGEEKSMLDKFRAKDDVVHIKIVELSKSREWALNISITS